MRVIYSFPNRIGVPGIGMTAWHQVAGLVALGVEVDLFCGSCERRIDGLHRLVETMRLGPCKVPYRLFGDDRVFAYHDWVVANKVLPQLGAIDVVHCWPSGAYRTLTIASNFGIPSFLERPSAHTAQAYDATALECQRLHLQMHPQHYAFSNKKRLTRESQEFMRADYLLCPSRFAAGTFFVRGFDSRQIRLHQYGYDPSAFPLPRKCKRTASEPFNVVFVGECFPLKGLHFALQAWLDSTAKTRGKFYICGRFMPEYRIALQQLLSHPSIESLGFVSDVSSIMQRCQAMVLPSLSEGSALVTYEARASGLVLLVSDATGAHCEHMQNGLVHHAGDVNMLRSHLEVLMNDSELLERLRAASVAGLGALTWASAAKRLKTIYEEAVSERSERSAIPNKFAKRRGFAIDPGCNV